MGDIPSSSPSPKAMEADDVASLRSVGTDKKSVSSKGVTANGDMKGSMSIVSGGSPRGSVVGKLFCPGRTGILSFGKSLTTICFFFAFTIGVDDRAPSAPQNDAKPHSVLADERRPPLNRHESTDDEDAHLSDVDNDEYGPVGTGEGKKNGRKLNRYPFQDVVDE